LTPDQIIDFELCLADTQPAVIGGLREEFVFGARLDNLVGSFTAIDGLLESLKDGTSIANDPNIRIVACFDNEECGSESAQGAMSSMFEWVLRRLTGDKAPECKFEEAIPKSFVISADQAHALHPNYKGKYDDNNSAAFHKGVVVKINANQRYATTAVTHAILKEVAAKAEVQLQPYVVRNDGPCGTTVGPIISSKLGLQTVDVGMPMLAMHSIREMCCISGIEQAVQLYKAFFEHYPAIQNSVEF